MTTRRSGGVSDAPADVSSLHTCLADGVELHSRYAMVRGNFGEAASAANACQ
jgi:hypothetical protein